MTRDTAIARATTYFDAGTFQSDLADLVTYHSESQNPAPEARAECLRYLEEAMLPRLTALGFTCEIIPNPDPAGGPLLLGERHEGDDLATILTYGHGDTVRGQEGMWRDGLTPWQIVEDGDRLYGRGTADNKSQHLINIAAMEAVLEARGHLGFNTRIVIEMTGSASRIVHRPLPVDDPRRRRPDITRASTLLGWGPRVPLTEGLEKTIRFFASTNQLPVQAMRLGAAFAPGTQSDPIVQI